MQLAGIAVDRPVIMASLVKQWYLEVGFVDVQERMYKIPTNGWPKDERLKEMGKMWERQWQTGLSGFSFWLFNRAFGRTSEHTEVCGTACVRVLVWFANWFACVDRAG